jgi:WD40 repeat protein
MYPTAFADEKNTSFPEDTFMTCSADNTIRFWNLELDENDSNRPSSLINPFSKQCLRTIFIGNDFTSMKARIDNGKYLITNYNILIQ